MTALRITNGDPSDFGLIFGLKYRLGIAFTAIGIVGVIGILLCLCVRSLNPSGAHGPGKLDATPVVAVRLEQQPLLP